MKTIVIYYSYSGHSKAIAEKIATEESADIVEIEDVKKPGKAKAYSAGCLAAMQGKAWPVKPVEVDLAAYDRLVLLSPVWAGNPPPAVNALLEILPEGKKVSVRMVSAGGSSACRKRIETVIQAKAGTL